MPHDLRQWSLIWVAILFAEAQTFGFKEIRWSHFVDLMLQMTNEIDGEPLSSGCTLELAKYGVLKGGVN